MKSRPVELFRTHIGVTMPGTTTQSVGMHMTENECKSFHVPEENVIEVFWLNKGTKEYEWYFIPYPNVTAGKYKATQEMILARVKELTEQADATGRVQKPVNRKHNEAISA